MNRNWAFIVIIVLTFLCVACTEEDSSRSSFSSLVSRAESARRAGEYNKAIELLKNALDIKPYDSQTHLILANLYFDMYQTGYKKAQDRMLQDVFVRKGWNSRDRMEVLKGYGLNPEYLELAIAEYRAVLVKDNKNCDAILALGNIFSEKKSYEEAEKYYKMLVQCNSAPIDLNSLLGNLFLKKGEYVSAREYLELAFAKDPTNDVNIYRLGVVYRKLNDSHGFKRMLELLKKKESPLYQELKWAMYRKH